MRLFVLGATGHTGTQILNLALARSHTVTAFTRSPEKITRRHPMLSVMRGDPHNVDQLTNAMQGHEVVLSALGVRPPAAFRPHTVVQDCAATVEAMSRTGVKRLVLVSAAVLFPMKGLLYAFFRLLLKHIARPPRLTKGPGEHYRASSDSLPAGAFSMSFRAVAAFMLDAVEQNSHLREVMGLG